MKKRLLLATVLLAMVLCACAGGNTPTEPATQPTTQPTEPATQGGQSLSLVVEDASLEADAQQLLAALASWSGRTVETVSAAPSGPTVVVKLEDLSQGNGIRPNDYRIEFADDTVTVVVGGQKALQKAVKALSQEVLPGKDVDDVFGGTLDTVYGWDVFYKLGVVEIGGHFLHEFVIVADESSKSALELQSIVKELGLYELPIVSGAEYKEGTPAFILTSGNAPCAQELQKSLEAHQHLIQIQGSQVFLLAGDAQQEAVSYKLFMARYMDYQYEPNRCRNTTYTFNEDMRLKFTTYFDGTDGYISSVNELLHVRAIDDWWGTQQGATGYGKYAFQFLIRKQGQNETGRLVKIDLETREIIKISETLPTYHSNDIAYNPETGKLYVIHYAPQLNTISIVDPETLEWEGTVTLPYDVYAIGYSVGRQQYAFADYNEDITFHIMDKDFQEVRSVTGQPTGYLIQGGFADDDFIYASRSALNDDKGNFVFVYDWDGNFQTKVEIKLGTELESVFRIGDMWYTVFHEGGGRLYETIVYKEIP